MKTLFIQVCCVWALVAGVEVQTDTGKVVGKQAEYHGLHNNGSYFSFHGIPYATPPVGSLRFHDPVPISPWNDVLDASGDPPAICPQLEFFDQSKFGQIVGSEDCLFLNIYTPEVPSNRSILRPVIFWIHGGGFAMGSGASKMMGGSGEDLLIEKDMVLVSINYRLGIFGFMALKGSTIQGNMGLKDQLEAMRWVKRNIAAFGGDPTRITIMGESAGGISVHEHVLSPMGKGEDLFHRAISLSGTALLMEKDRFNRFTEESSRRAFELLCNANLTEDHHGYSQYHGNHGLPKNLTATCLYSLPTIDIAKKMNEFFDVKMLNSSVEDQLKFPDMMFFAPITDDWAHHPFSPEHPVTILTNHQQKMVPFMSGTTKDEGGMYVAQLWRDMDPADNKLQKNWKEVGPWKLFKEIDASKITWDQKVYADMIARFYVGENGLNRENKQGLIDLFTDWVFAGPNTETIKLHARSSTPVYNYRFSYKGSFSLASIFAMGYKDAMEEDFGVSHADDLLYIFRWPFPHLVTANDVKMADTFLILLTSFARYRDPTPFGGSSQSIPKWNPAQNSARACIYMEINEHLLEKHNMNPTRMEFFRRVYFQNILNKYGENHGQQDHQVHHRHHQNNHHDDHHGDNNEDHHDNHGDDMDHHGYEHHNDHHGGHHQSHDGQHGDDHGNHHDKPHGDNHQGYNHHGDNHHENHDNHHGDDHGNHHADDNDHDGNHNHHGNDHHGEHRNYHEDQGDHHGNQHGGHHGKNHDDDHGDHDDEHGDNHHGDSHHGDDHGNHNEDHNDHHGNHNDHHGNDHHHGDHHSNHHDDHHGDHDDEHAGHGDQVHHSRRFSQRHSGH